MRRTLGLVGALVRLDLAEIKFDNVGIQDGM